MKTLVTAFILLMTSTSLAGIQLGHGTATPLGKDCSFIDSAGYRNVVRYVTTIGGDEFAEISSDELARRWVLGTHMKYSIFEMFVDDAANSHSLYNSFQENFIKVEENGKIIYSGACTLL
jgi:hypothetical protein